MADKIARDCKLETVLVTSSVSTSGSFNMAQKAGGVFHVSAASGNLTLNFYSVPDLNAGTAFLVRDSSNATVAISIAAPGGGTSYCYPLPDQLFGCAKVIPVVTQAGQTATFRVLLKT